MPSYLFGAKVQGIQGFIFDTGKLKEIAGASELIESIAGDYGWFASLVREAVGQYHPNELLRNAAGEIRYVFTDKASCESIVRIFERRAYRDFPSLHFSQAVVQLGVQEDLKQANGKVNRLLQTQRVRTSSPLELGWMINERARRTGRPGVATDGRHSATLVDRTQESKRQQSNSLRLYEKLIGKDHGLRAANLAFEMEDLKGGKERAWLAVVHADGNSLGELIQQLLGQLRADSVKEGYRKFSETLEAATVAAAQTAYSEVVAPIYDQERAERQKAKLPIRPVVIGGDDLTVIIRGDLAIKFTASYLAAFEQQTAKLFGEYAKEFSGVSTFNKGLTACAGIVFVKPKYPFHYAAHLAEELCSWTKKITKDLTADSPKSALHFHKVQSSFISDYGEIIERELLTVEKKQLTAGPYYLANPEPGYHTINDLLDYQLILEKSDTPTGPLRDYMGELRVDEAAAQRKLQRILDVNPNRVLKDLDLQPMFRSRKQSRRSGQIEATHLYDAIQLQRL